MQLFNNSSDNMSAAALTCGPGCLSKISQVRQFGSKFQPIVTQIRILQATQHSCLALKVMCLALKVKSMLMLWVHIWEGGKAGVWGLSQRRNVVPVSDASIVLSGSARTRVVGRLRALQRSHHSYS